MASFGDHTVTVATTAPRPPLLRTRSTRALVAVPKRRARRSVLPGAPGTAAQSPPSAAGRAAAGPLPARQQGTVTDELGHRDQHRRVINLGYRRARESHPSASAGGHRRRRPGRYAEAEERSRRPARHRPCHRARDRRSRQFPQCGERRGRGIVPSHCSSALRIIVASDSPDAREACASRSLNSSGKYAAALTIRIRHLISPYSGRPANHARAKHARPARIMCAPRA